MNAWGCTDKGVSRTQNQDYYHLEVVREEGYALCVICDGMGGARAGNVAAELAVRTFVEEMRLGYRPSLSSKAVRALLRQATRSANAKVFEKAREKGEFFGMGTTLVGGIVTATQAVIVNVGDSRAYLGFSDGLTRITRDHSVVEDLLMRGELSPEEARVHPSRNLITRALGTDSDVKCDIFTTTLRPRAYVLFCSDGLTNAVEEQEILYEVLHGGDPALCCGRLLTIANARGGPDNITVILVSL